MTVDIEKLKLLAEACLPLSAPQDVIDEFRVAANPAAVLELIAEIEKFDDSMRALACSLGAGGYNAVTLTADQLVGKVNAGLEMFTTSTGGLLDKVTAERDALKVENEALRKDAERYRWLSKRDRWASVGADFGPGGVYRQHRVCWHVGDNWPQVEGHSMGEAIDAAMSKDASHD